MGPFSLFIPFLLHSFRLVPPEGCPYNLDGHFTAQMDVLGTVHLAHDALADLFDGFVMADGGADYEVPLAQCSCLQCYICRGRKGNQNWPSKKLV